MARPTCGTLPVTLVLKSHRAPALAPCNLRLHPQLCLAVTVACHCAVCMPPAPCSYSHPMAMASSHCCDGCRVVETLWGTGCGLYPNCALHRSCWISPTRHHHDQWSPLTVFIRSDTRGGGPHSQLLYSFLLNQVHQADLDSLHANSRSVCSTVYATPKSWCSGNASLCWHVSCPSAVPVCNHQLMTHAP